MWSRWMFQLFQFRFQSLQSRCWAQKQLPAACSHNAPVQKRFILRPLSTLPGNTILMHFVKLIGKDHLRHPKKPSYCVLICWVCFASWQKFLAYFSTFLSLCFLAFFILQLCFHNNIPGPLFLLCSSSFPSLLSFLFLHSPPFLLSSWQISGCVFEPSTRSTNLPCVPGSPRTSNSLWNASLNCSAVPAFCCVLVTSAPLSATSSSLSCRTWTLSGLTTWAARCWRPSRASSSQTLWREPLGKKEWGCWSALIRTTMKKAGSCCLTVRHTAQQVTKCTGKKVSSQSDTG